jgi:hypothetical protein
VEVDERAVRERGEDGGRRRRRTDALRGEQPARGAQLAPARPELGAGALELVTRDDGVALLLGHRGAQGARLLHQLLPAGENSGVGPFLRGCRGGDLPHSRPHSTLVLFGGGHHLAPRRLNKQGRSYSSTLTIFTMTLLQRWTYVSFFINGFSSELSRSCCTLGLVFHHYESHSSGNSAPT